MLVFGPGDLFGVPLLDASGNTITNPTPIKVGAMQSMSIDFAGDLKELYGQNQLPISVARGKVKTSGKFTGAHINAAAVNTLYFGQTVVAGTQTAGHVDNVGSVIPGTPYQITPTVPSSGTWAEDFGVIDSNGLPMTRVASSPASGQYSVSAGAYTFAAADTGQRVFISFRYTVALASAKSITINNLAMGAAPTWKAHMVTSFQGKRALVTLNSVVSTKLQLLATKLDDYNLPEFEFGAFADSANVLGIIQLQE